MQLEDTNSWKFFPSVLQSPTTSDPTWRIFIYPEKIQVSLFTQHKTSHRSMYNAARSLLNDPSKGQEILLQNSHGEVMEGSISTPYFWRGARWVTPSHLCGGNLGTTRRWALEKNLATEGIIMACDIYPGEKILLSNGVHGFAWGCMEALHTRSSNTPRDRRLSTPPI